MMRLKVNQENNALYLRLDENLIMDLEEVQPGVILDYDEDGNVVGVNFLNIDIIPFR